MVHSEHMGKVTALCVSGLQQYLYMCLYTAVETIFLVCLLLGGICLGNIMLFFNKIFNFVILHLVP